MPETATYLPELPESEVPPELRAIYQEYRRLTAVPMVPLIYRHLATIPGALPEAWNGLSPLFKSGRLQDAAWTIASSVDIDPPARIEPLALDALGIDPDSRTAILTVLGAYNRANPVNLLAVCCIAQRLSSRPSPTIEQPTRPWTPPKAFGPLPPMTAPAEMPTRVLRLVEDLAINGRNTGPQRAVPSLYRHLVQWPSLLGVAHVLLKPRFADGSIEREAVRVRSAMRQKAQDLAPMLAPMPSLAEVPAARDALVRFAALIPEMIVVGTLLRKAMPDG